MTIHAPINSGQTPAAHRSANSAFELCAAARAQMPDRCLTVLELLTDGHSNKEIAAQLRVSMATVKAYVSEILRAFNVDNRTQAALIGLRLRYGLEIVETRLSRK